MIGDRWAGGAHSLYNFRGRECLRGEGLFTWVSCMHQVRAQRRADLATRQCPARENYPDSMRNTVPVILSPTARSLGKIATS